MNPSSRFSIDAAEQVAQAVGDRAAHQRIGVTEAVVAALQPHFAFELVGRALGDHVDRAADGVAAVQRALRAAQDLGALDEQRRRRSVGHRGREDAVRVQRDGWIGADCVGQTAEAADRETIVVAIGDARREAREIFHRVDAEQSARLARVRGHGDRYVLNVDCALFRGDDHFFEHRSSGRFLRERCGAAKAQHTADRARQQRSLFRLQHENPHSGRAMKARTIFVCRIDDRSAVTFDGMNSCAEQQYALLSRTTEPGSETCSQIGTCAKVRRPKKTPADREDRPASVWARQEPAQVLVNYRSGIAPRCRTCAGTCTRGCDSARPKQTCSRPPSHNLRRRKRSCRTR